MEKIRTTLTIYRSISPHQGVVILSYIDRQTIQEIQELHVDFHGNLKFKVLTTTNTTLPKAGFLLPSFLTEDAKKWFYTLDQVKDFLYDDTKQGKKDRKREENKDRP